MKYIFVNLKRFDVPSEIGGVNRNVKIDEWAKYLIQGIKSVEQFKDMTFVTFLPEAHLLNAKAALGESDNFFIGCQSVYREDITVGGNFGAFTTNLPAKAARILGCAWTVIGHCEERKDKLGIITELTGQIDNNVIKAGNEAVNRILNKQIKCAVEAGMKVLYCIGETTEEQPFLEEVLSQQIHIGLDSVGKSNIAIAYEPVWAIGPGKTPPDREYIDTVSKIIKKAAGDIPVIYGGGLKEDNAAMLADIDTIDGGLVALTRFSGDIGFYPDEFIKIVKKYRGEE